MTPDEARGCAEELQLLHGDRMPVMFHGLSMDPLLFEGDLVVVEPVSFDDVQVGDVVTYRHLDRYPTRRVVGIEPDRLVLWCDAWPTLRFRADAGDLLGRAVARNRNGYELCSRSPEWQGRTSRALRRYRLVRPYLEARRALRGLRRRLAGAPGP